MSQAESHPGALARQAILAAAIDRGWGVVDDAWWHEAALADGDLARPGIGSALDALRRRRTRAVVVAKRERGIRVFGDLVQLMDVVTLEHWALVAVAYDVRTRHGRSALVTFAPFERLLLGERTRAALAARKAAGLHVGRKPGVPKEIVGRIVAERQTGASLNSIARGLNEDGISGSGGGRWYASTVRYLLTGVGTGR